VGRARELARICDRIEQGEVVVLICGVAGIGKSELAIRAVEHVEQRSAWRGARVCRAALVPGMGIEHAIAQLRIAAEVTGRADYLALEDGLEPIVEALDARPTIVRFDDLHVLDDDAAGRLLGYLTRHLRSSVVIATSRRELVIPPPSPAATVIRLRPLEVDDSRRMVELLADTLGLADLDHAAVVVRSGGSPFYIRHELVSPPFHQRPANGDVLAGSLDQLGPTARTLLLQLAVLELPLDRATIVDETSLDVLSRRFLVDTVEGQLSTHALVRDIAIRTASAIELRDAHRWAADLFAAREVPDPTRRAIHGIAVIRHLSAAGERDRALAFMLAHQRAISRAGLDHRLLEYLRDLSGGGAERDFAIDLARAHILLRQSRISEARVVLEARSADPLAESSAPYFGLVSSVAMREGDLLGVEAALRRALAVTTTERTRRRLTLYIADLYALRGDGERARELLAERDTSSNTAAMRWLRSYLVSLIFDLRFADAVSAARAHRTTNTGATPDLDVQIAMLEVVALAEVGEARAARTIFDGIIAPAARTGTLRERVVQFYAGLVAWVEGDLATARVRLEASCAYLVANHDAVLAGIAGHYLGRTLLAIGDAPSAYRYFTEGALRAEHMGIGLAPLGRAYAAAALVRLGRLDEARATLDAVLATSVFGSARAVAHRVTARLAAARGDRADVRAALAAAAAALIAPDAAHRIDLDLERVELELEPGSAPLARIALDHYLARGAQFSAARAAVVLATAHAIADSASDRVVAEQALARAEALTEAGAYRDLAARVVVVRAVLTEQASGRTAALEQLARALNALVDPTPTVVALLGSALAGVPSPELAVDDLGLLRALGLVERCDLVVDLPNSSISRPNGAEVRGRAMLCELLVRLIDAGGQPLEADEIYRTVWGAAEYHPLRHRNTLYAAVNRLRRVLADLLPERGELITTGPEGWFLRTATLATRVVRS
jgi:hypothetical protein